MSGNPYRRSGGPPAQNGQQGPGNGYYRMTSSQYHHNNNNNGHNRNYKHNHSSHGYGRGRYNHNYGNQYDTRHNLYHSPHHNSRYHQQASPYNSGSVNGNMSSTSNNNLSRHSYPPSNTNPLSGTDNSYSSESKVSFYPVHGENTSAQMNSKSDTSTVRSAQLLSSRRGNGSENFSSSTVNATTSNSSPVAKAPHPDAKIENMVKAEKNEEITEKKPLDINSLQQMKKKKPGEAPDLEVEQKNFSVEAQTKVIIEVKEEKSIPKTEQTQTNEDTKAEDVEHQEISKNGDVEHQYFNTEDTDNHAKERITDEAIQHEITKNDDGNPEVLKDLTDENKDHDIKRKESTISDSKVIEKGDNSDDEDEPIQPKIRHVTSEAPSKEESEEETDIEDSIPVPSRKTRRLHRLLKSSNMDSAERNDGTTASTKLTISKKRTDSSNLTSNSHSSRSQSPKQRKTSRAGRDASGRTLLQRMCAKGNIDEVRRLIEEGQNINDADFAGITPLHEAALEGHYEITKILLENGADINIQSGQMDKDTPLIDAVSNLHYKVVQLLLTRGANPNIQNAQGQNTFDVLESTIKEYEEDNEEVPPDAKKIKKLILQYSQNFAENDSLSSDKISRERSNSIATDDEAHSLSNNQLSYPSLRKGGLNSLQERISANDVTFVLNYVSNMNGKKIPPESLLLASKLGFPDIASLLIAFGADINFKDKNGWTPLMHAVGKGHLEMVKLLLSNQVNVAVKDKKDRTALDILKENGLCETEEYTLLLAKSKEMLALEPNNSDKMDIDQEDESSEGDEEDNKDNDEDEDIEYDNESQVDKSFTEEEPSLHGKKRNLPTKVKSEDVKNDQDTVSDAPHISKKQKTMDEKRAGSSDKAPSASASSSPALSVRKTASKQRKKHDDEPEEKKVTPIPPTAEEIEAHRLKEIEAQKAREALEHQRLERKKLKQQEIAKRIDAIEKQREEEKKALEKLTLEKRRKEEEEQSMLLKKQEESRKKEELKYAIEKRKLIRDYYPYGLKKANFGGKLSKSEIESFLPLYVFKIGDAEYLIDLQLNLLFGVESLYSKYPQLDKRKVRLEEKKGLWNVLWPLIGSFQNGYKPVEELQQVYESEGNNFKELVLNWVRLDAFEELIKTEELRVVHESVERIGLCHAALVIETSQVSVSDADGANAVNNNTIEDIEPTDNRPREFPRRFGKKARTALKMMNKPLW